jgi:hypothetical protein
MFKILFSSKKYYNSDIDKSYKYFKQCAILLEQLKKNKKTIENNILEETEIECNKYISNIILDSIERPTNPDKKLKKKEIIFSYENEDNILFEVIEKGNIDFFKDYSYGDINFKIYNSNGLTPLHYAIKYGDVTFVKNSLKLGASIDQTNMYGNTLLEFACLEKDPNMIHFLMEHGANMQKHLSFRESKKYFNRGSNIDIILLEKYIMDIEINNISYNNYLDWIYIYINKNDKIDLELAGTNISESIQTISFESFINQLNKLLYTLNDEYRNTYIDIIKEELNYNISSKLGCPHNKIDIILYNLIPFINYNNTFHLLWLISCEIKYLIFKIFKNKIKINFKELKNELLELIFNTYIKDNIIPEGLLQIVVLQWISKINI